MLAVAYLGLIIFIVFFEFTRKKVTTVDFITLFNINFTLMYPLPAFILDAALGDTSEMWMDDKFYVSNLQTAVAIFAGYFLVIIGFASKASEKFAKKVIIQSYSKKSVITFAVLLLLFACLSIYIYSSQYGGFMTALSKTNLIRAGAEEHSGPLLFFKRFLYCSFLSSYLLGSFVIFNSNKDIKKNWLTKIAFFISLIVSLIAFTLCGARAPFINFILVFYFGYVLKTNKFSWSFTIIFTLVSAIFVSYGKQLFFSLTALPEGLFAVVEKFTEAKSNAPDEGVLSFYKVISNFVYPVYSLDTAFTQVYELRFFEDWIYGFASLLPQKLSGIDVPETVTYYNTLFIANSNEYGIQPGFLAFGIYSMSWMGLILICLVYGWVGRYLQTILTIHLNKIIWMPFFYIFIGLIWLDLQIFGNPQEFFQTNFWALLSIIFLFIFASKISIATHVNLKNGGKSLVR